MPDEHEPRVGGVRAERGERLQQARQVLVDERRRHAQHDAPVPEPEPLAQLGRGRDDGLGAHPVPQQHGVDARRPGTRRIRTTSRLTASEIVITRVARRAAGPTIARRPYSAALGNVSG